MMQKQIDCLLHQEDSIARTNAETAFLSQLARLAARMGMRPEVVASILCAGLQESLMRGLIDHQGDLSPDQARELIAQARNFRLCGHLREDHDALVSRLTPETRHN